MLEVIAAVSPSVQVPLDHLFHSSHFRLAQMRVLPSIGSDHFPILVNLSLEESAKQSQPTSTPGPDKVEEVEEEIEDGAVEEREEEKEEETTESEPDSSDR